MKPEERSELELYAAGRLPAERTDAIERLVRQDDEARRFLATLIGGNDRTTNRPGTSRQSARYRSSRSRKRQTRLSLLRPHILISVSIVGLVAIATAVVMSGYLPTPTAPSLPTETRPSVVSNRPEIPAVFHPPRFSPVVVLHESANSMPRRDGVAARALLYRDRTARSRPTLEEILALQLANAAPDSAPRLERIAMLADQQFRTAARLERSARQRLNSQAKAPGR